MKPRRTDRLNSLLKEVISDVIHKDVKNPHLPHWITVTQVDVTRDLRQAKVHVSVMGDAETKKLALITLRSAAGFIAATASKKIVIRYFPALTFHLDESIDQQIRLETVLHEIHEEQATRTKKVSETDEISETGKSEKVDAEE